MTRFCVLLIVMGLLLTGNPAQAKVDLAAAPVASATGAKFFHAKVTGEGPALVLLPGLGCSGEVWDPLVDKLKANWQCHILTPAGFAGQPPVSATPYLDALCESLAAYIRDAKLTRPVVAGHSLGGVAVLRLAIKAPELPSAVISADGVPFSPALLDPSATADSMRSQALQRFQQSTAMTREQFNAQNDFLLRTMITKAEDVARVAAWMARSDRATLIEAAYELATLDLRREVKAIQVPVLVVGAGAFAQDDPGFREALVKNYRSQLSGLARLRFEWADRARHFIMLDDPAFLLNAMESFLQEVQAGIQPMPQK